MAQWQSGTLAAPGLHPGSCRDAFKKQRYHLIHHDTEGRCAVESHIRPTKAPVSALLTLLRGASPVSSKQPDRRRGSKTVPGTRRMQHSQASHVRRQRSAPLLAKTGAVVVCEELAMLVSLAVVHALLIRWRGCQGDSCQRQSAHIWQEPGQHSGSPQTPGCYERGKSHVGPGTIFDDDVELTDCICTMRGAG